MKLLKIIIPILTVYFLFTPLQKAFAEELNSNDFTSTANLINLFDRDESTFVETAVSKKMILTLKKPQYITRFYAIRSGSLEVRYLDKENKVIKMEYYSNQSELSPPQNTMIYSIEIKGTSTGNKVYELYIEGNNPIDHTGDIKEFNIKSDYKSVSLNWDLIDKEKYAVSKINIYRDGKLIKSVSPDMTSFKDESLKPETNYTYKITYLYSDGFETVGKEKQAYTDIEPPVYLKNIETIPGIDDISITWREPGRYKEIQKIEVYRNGNLINTGKFLFFDDNVNLLPNKEYIYTFKVISLYGKETIQEEIKVRTLKEPIPVIEGANFKNITGDYQISWEQPETGKIQIFVGGKLYKEVNANTKLFTIPSKDMKTNSIGNPDVYIKPIAKHGTEGEIIEAPKTNNIPFSVEDLLLTGNSLLHYVGPLVLLGLVFLLYPKLKKVITSSNKDEKGEKERQEKRERRSKEDIKTKQEKMEKNKKLKERQEREKRKLKKEIQKVEKEVKKVEQLPKERKGARPPRMTRKTASSIKIKREPRHINKREIRTARETREPREPRNRDRRF